MLEIAPWTAIFWTITPEFQFYILFPILLGLMNKIGSQFILYVIFSCFVVRVFVGYFVFDVSQLSYGTIVGRIDQFLIGMLTAAWVQDNFFRSRFAAFLFPVACILVFCALFGFHFLGGLASYGVWRSVWPTVEGAFWAFFIVTYLATAGFVPNFVAKGLVIIGEASYSIYLIHLAVISLLHWQAGNLFLLSPLSRIGLTPAFGSLIVVAFILAPIALAISMVTYRWIERPFLSLRVGYLRSPAAQPVERGT